MSHVSEAVRRIASAAASVRAGAVVASMVIASVSAPYATAQAAAPAPGSAATSDESAKAAAFFRDAMAKIAGTHAATPQATADAMRQSAKETLIAAKSNGLDARVQPQSAADFMRNRVRAVLYVAVNGMSADETAKTLHLIADEALAGRYATVGRTASGAPVQAQAQSPVQVAASPIQTTPAAAATGPSAASPGVHPTSASPSPVAAAQRRAATSGDDGKIDACFRDAMTKVASTRAATPQATADAMRQTAREALIAAKINGMDARVRAQSQADFMRNRLRAVLYFDGTGMSAADARKTMSLIATEALGGRYAAVGKTPAQAFVEAPAPSQANAPATAPASASPATAANAQPARSPASPYAPPAGSGMAADISVPVTPTFLAHMRQMGVKTIVRYYDHVDETLRGKTLHRAERDLIVNSGFNIAVVFQHHNDQIASFNPERGRLDAERSVALATENAQQVGSMVYMGVDGDWIDAASVRGIHDYFVEANKVLKGRGFQVGVYGSGATCGRLMREGLATKCWLAQSTGFSGYHAMRDSKQWSMAQLSQQRVEGINVDLDLVDEGHDIGQFGR